MAAVTLTDVNVLVRAKLQSDARRQRNLFEWAPCTQDNPAPFNHPLKFEISYQCFSSLKHGKPIFTANPTRRAQEAVHTGIIGCMRRLGVGSNIRGIRRGRAI